MSLNEKHIFYLKNKFLWAYLQKCFKYWLILWKRLLWSILRNFYNTYLEEHLRTAASSYILNKGLNRSMTFINPICYSIFLISGIYFPTWTTLNSSLEINRLQGVWKYTKIYIHLLKQTCSLYVWPSGGHQALKG